MEVGRNHRADGEEAEKGAESKEESVGGHGFGRLKGVEGWVVVVIAELVRSGAMDEGYDIRERCWWESIE